MSPVLRLNCSRLDHRKDGDQHGRDEAVHHCATAGISGHNPGVSEKGKIIKRYNHQDVKTPLECLALLNEKGLVTFKAGITLEDLLAQASEKTDLQAAREMQHEGRFVCFVQQAQTQTAGLKPVLSLSKGHSNQGGVVRKKTMRAGGGLRRLGGGLDGRKSEDKNRPL